MKIEDNGILYAQHISLKNDLQQLGKTQWIGKESFSLQGSIMYYDANKSFVAHSHILNPRLINKTQECFIIIKGKIKVTISVKIPHENNYCLHDLGYLIGEPGDAIFVWNGFHQIDILENDTIAYEIKAGQFNGVVSEDKEIADNKTIFTAEYLNNISNGLV